MAGNRMKVQFKSIYGKLFEVDCRPEDTVYRLKKHISQQYSLAVNQVFLIWNGKVRANSSMVKDFFTDTTPFTWGQYTKPMIPSKLLASMRFEDLNQEMSPEMYEKFIDVLTEMASKEPSNTKNITDYWNSLVTNIDKTTAGKVMEILTKVGVKELDEKAQEKNTLAQPSEPYVSSESVKPISFKEFHTTFLALFDDTNSTGIKQVLKKMKEVSDLETDDLQKFQLVGQFMKDVANKRRDYVWSRSNFFGPGRSTSVTAFYDVASSTLNVSGTLKEVASSFESLANTIISASLANTIIRSDLAETHNMKIKPDQSFEKFREAFVQNYGKTTSTGIKKVLKQLEALSKKQDDPLKNSDQYKFTKICKIMRDVTDERADKIKSGRSNQTKKFYQTVRSPYETMHSLIKNILTIPVDEKLAAAPPRSRGRV